MTLKEIPFGVQFFNQRIINGYNVGIMIGVGFDMIDYTALTILDDRKIPDPSRAIMGNQYRSVIDQDFDLLIPTWDLVFNVSFNFYEIVAMSVEG